jgi:HPt (histidine-containing phosphotransfer) domain-containing protein
MADIVEFTNRRKQATYLQRDFIDFLLQEIPKILEQIDNAADRKELLQLMDKLHKFTESLHAVGYQSEDSFGDIKKT